MGPSPKEKRYPFGKQYDADSCFLVENRRGDLFFGGYSKERKGLCLSRWRDGEDWRDLGCFSGGGGFGLRGLLRPPDSCFEADCPEREELVFLVQEKIMVFSLLRLDYDGQVRSRVELDRSRSYQWVSCFPDGDVLLFAWEEGTERDSYGIDLAIRLPPEGQERWVYRRPVPTQPIEVDGLPQTVCAPGKIRRALAMADGTALLWIDNEDGNCTGVLHMEHLDREGSQMADSGSPGYQGLGTALPRVFPEEQGWVVEDSTRRRIPGSFCSQVRFTRFFLDRTWRVTGQESTRPLVLGTDLETTQARFVSGEVLAATVLSQRDEKGALTSANWIIQAPFCGEPRRVMVRQEGTGIKQIAFDMPMFRREDGTFVLLLEAPGKSARFEAVGVSPAGEVFWKRPYRCEGKRWFLLRRDRLVVVMASVLGEARSVILYLP